MEYMRDVCMKQVKIWSYPKFMYSSIQVADIS